RSERRSLPHLSKVSDPFVGTVRSTSADAPDPTESPGLHYYVPRSSMKSVNDPGLLILTSLSSGPKHGHALLLDIDTFAGVRLGPGTLYGAISRLEEHGLIEPLDADDRRRPYRLTAAGTAVLADSLRGLRRIVEAGTTRLAA